MHPYRSGGLVPPCLLQGQEPTPLSRTLSVLGDLVPPERTLVAAPPSVRRWWGTAVSGAGARLVELPVDRGTALAVFVPFLHAFRRDPGATVVVVPGNAGADTALAVGLRAVALRATALPEKLALLGSRPGAWEPGIDLLVPFSPDGDGQSLLVTGVGPATWQALRGRGASCWRGVLAAGSAAMLLAYDRAMPGLLPAMAAHCRGRDPMVVDWEPLLRGTPWASFRRHVLAASAEAMVVVDPEVAGCPPRDDGVTPPRAAPMLADVAPKDGRNNSMRGVTAS